jgi:hypothetical protein
MHCFNLLFVVDAAWCRVMAVTFINGDGNMGSSSWF